MGSKSPSEDETIAAAKRTSEGPLSLRIILGDRVVSQALPEKGELVLGRGEEVDVLVDHRSVSRQHVRLRLGPGTIVVEDLGSANGTRVGGKSIARETPTPARAGEAIELGDVVVVIQRGHVVERQERPAEVNLSGSAAMQEVSRLIERIAPGTISVLVIGETGVGKELVAEAIHRRSPRANKPLVRLNCAAVSPSLLESEWFGYERGAFTGATQPKLGLLETADGGTVVLDEIGELAADLQAKLLRVLEDRAVMRVGGIRPRRIDVRFVASTNRDLEAAIAAGRFRQDLYFRLNGVTVAVPPLRERRGEILPLAMFFASEFAAGRPETPTIDREAQACLEAYDWPGNVRELRNVIDRAVLLVEPGRPISTADLPPALKPGARVADAEPEQVTSRSRQSLHDGVAALEKQRVVAALAEAHGNQKRAAEILGISRGTLLSRLETFGIARPRKGPAKLDS